MKVALLWVNYGPYHLARLRALRQAMNVLAIEFAAAQDLYGWKVDHSRDVLTLSANSYERTNGWRTARTLWRVLNSERPQFLFVPGYREPLALVAAAWGRLHRRKNVLMTDSTESDQRRFAVWEWLKSLVVRMLFDRAFVSGRRSAQYLAKLRFPEHAISNGYDVVDNRFFAEGTDSLRSGVVSAPWTTNRPYFLYVGRLAPEKNLSALVGQFSAYRARGGTWDLVLVGQGPLEMELRDEVRRIGCDAHVQFAGFKQGAELLPPYAYASCFILPSTREPWGLVVNEAMASGLPVIVSTRCGCSDDLVEHGGNGFIFDPAREDELAECMSRMSAMSDEERARMGQRSREIIANFSLERWASEVLRLVQEQPSVVRHKS